MCGIIGIITKNKEELHKIEVATQTLSNRGPDFQKTIVFNSLALGHARLSIIDTSAVANQPFFDSSGRYVIVYNGEIFNFQELKDNLIKEGIQFFSNSDTEVLLNLYIKLGKKCLELLNGFFAFAIYDKEQNKLFVARDRIGVKPLLYYTDECSFIFGSELKAILSFKIDNKIDNISLFNYFQFNYIPSNNSIFSKVKKLKPGHCIEIDLDNEVIKAQEQLFYSIPYNTEIDKKKSIGSYENAKKQLYQLLDDAVQKRLIADVPVGTFLSGGVDSSVISTLAKRHLNDLNTFSIGYKENRYYDETHYAESVAKKIGSTHHTFLLSSNDIKENLIEILDYIDEPFADSSAIAVYFLCKNTRKQIAVALSGDGADEIFSGYNKHAAEYRIRNSNWKDQFIKYGYPLWKSLPKSRNSYVTDLNRKLYKFSLGANLSNKERYWLWASILDEKNTSKLFDEKSITEADFLNAYQKRKNNLLKNISSNGDLNDVLYTDTHMVLVQDMLRKVDSMSMANSLEVRTPFLDYRVVEFAFSLPEKYKIDNNIRKKIVQDTFRNILPEEIYNRPKHGFEIPLLSLVKEIFEISVFRELLSDDFINEQKMFSVERVKDLKKQLFSNNPNDVASTIWAMIVFNYWWKKYYLAK